MSTSQNIRVLLVDDHPIVRDSVCELIGREGDMTVCGQVDSVADALELIATGEPDVAIVDLTLKGGSGLELIARALESPHQKNWT